MRELTANEQELASGGIAPIAVWAVVGAGIAVGYGVSKLVKRYSTRSSCAESSAGDIAG